MIRALYLRALSWVMHPVLFALVSFSGRVSPYLPGLTLYLDPPIAELGLQMYTLRWFVEMVF
jgi:hypothetical protein